TGNWFFREVPPGRRWPTRDCCRWSTWSSSSSTTWQRALICPAASRCGGRRVRCPQRCAGRSNRATPSVRKGHEMDEHGSPFRCAVLSVAKHDYVARGVASHPRFELTVVADDPQVPDWIHERNQLFADANR